MIAEANFQECTLWGILAHVHKGRCARMFIRLVTEGPEINVHETHGGCSLHMA